MPLASDTLRVVHRYWGELLGCAPEHFAQSEALVVPHTGMGDYPGVFLFGCQDSLTVSAPANEVDAVRGKLAGFGAVDVRTPEKLLAALGRAGEVVGPAAIHYCDQETYRPMAALGVRLLDPNDVLELKALRKACSDKDWEYGGSDLSERPLAGQFSDNVLTAIASYVVWGGDIAHISVVTHPDFRGLGYGKGVVSAITEVAISRALIPQYRTLLANVSSMGIAQSLGFRHYATSLAVRTSNAAG